MDITILKGLFNGFLFGLALYIVGATNRSNLLEMLQLRNLRLMKIILFAIGFASVLIFASLYLGILPESRFNIKGMYLGVPMGGAILAFGFGFIGLCPGTSLGALTSGYIKSIAVILGGLLGSYIFARSYGFLSNFGIFKPLWGGKVTLFQISENYPALFNIGPWGGIAVGCIFMLIALALPEKLSSRRKNYE